MSVLITGSTGLIGSALVTSFISSEDHVVRLVRSGGCSRAAGSAAGSAGDVSSVMWDPSRGEIDAAGLEGVDTVVHLAGESVAGRRWNDAQRARIRDSRVLGTRLLVGTLSRLETRPRVLVSASAVGIYGDRGDQVLGESASHGSGFLADVCREWEAEALSAEAFGVRVVLLRIGMVLSGAGGALGRMLPVFRLGLGGRLGDGASYMPWISLGDLVRAVRFVVSNESIAGAVNVVGPNPVMNREFTSALGRVLGRPALFAVPAWALRMMMGEMADGVLWSQRAVARRLLDSGFRFEYPELEGALRETLGR